MLAHRQLVDMYLPSGAVCGRVQASGLLCGCRAQACSAARWRSSDVQVKYELLCGILLQAEQGEGDNGDDDNEDGEEEEEKTKDKEQGEPNVAGREQVAPCASNLQHASWLGRCARECNFCRVPPVWYMCSWESWHVAGSTR